MCFDTKRIMYAQITKKKMCVFLRMLTNDYSSPFSVKILFLEGMLLFVTLWIDQGMV